MNDSMTVNLVANGYIVCPTASVGRPSIIATNYDIRVFEDFNGLVAYLRMEMGPDAGELTASMPPPKAKK